MAISSAQDGATNVVKTDNEMRSISESSPGGSGYSCLHQMRFGGHDKLVALTILLQCGVHFLPKHLKRLLHLTDKR